MKTTTPVRGGRVRSVPVLLTLVALAVGAGCAAPNRAELTAEAAAGVGAPGGPVVLWDGSTVRLALVPAREDPLTTPWRSTADTVRADLGLAGAAFDAGSGGNQDLQNRVIEALAAQGNTAFGIAGAAPGRINATFESLKARGLAVGALGTCPAGDTTAADFCLATDAEEAGYQAGRAVVDAIGGEGAIVQVTGAPGIDTTRRVAGVSRAIAEAGDGVSELPVVTLAGRGPAATRAAVSALLAKQGRQVAGIVVSAYEASTAVAEALAGSGLPVKVVTSDDDPAVLAAVRSGAVTATVVQNPVGQAEVGSWVLALLATQQCTMTAPGAQLDSGSFVVTRDTVDRYDADRRARTESLYAEFARLLSCQ